ncbi:MAG: gluconokinase [Sporomusaceae bacterium]|nr:gluconokinase [Sporomusaceae bacterium]
MDAAVMIGVDIGTSGCRAVAFSSDGVAAGCGYAAEYPLYTPRTDWAEQDPELIWQATAGLIRSVAGQVRSGGGRLLGICFSSVWHSFVPVDAAGAALAPMLIWGDSRSQRYSEQLRREQDAAAIYARTGCPVHPMYYLPRLLWFRRERPELFARTAKFISIKEYVLYRLTGEYIVDRSIASGSGMYNLYLRDWDPALLALAGISASQLSAVASTTQTVPLLPAAAVRLGLDAATPLVLGAGDGALANIGSGAVRPGQITASIGTSGAVRTIVDAPRTDPRGRTWCYNLTDAHWVIGGAINNGGIAFRWARDKFAASEQQVAAKLEIDAYELLSRYAEQKPAGSDGLIMLPFFSGERAPYWNADARGVLFGLNLNHGKRHLIRATMEGIVYRMFSIFTALQEVAGPADEVRVSGSFVRSGLWLQIMADMFGTAIAVPEEAEGTAFGAAILGLYALGIIDSFDRIAAGIHIRKQYLPDAGNQRRYRQLYEIYERIYWKLQPEFAEIARLQRDWSQPEKV